MTKFRAFGWHVLISAGVGVALLALCWFVWYPEPMLIALGGHEIFFLILAIDVIVGPLLTLIVYKPAKSSLTFDLAVIGTLQVSAAIYGVSTILEARPVYIASLGKEFHVIQATEVTDENLKKAEASMPLWGPRLVGTRDDMSDALRDLVSDLRFVGADKGHVPQLHIPYVNVRKEVAAESLSISDLMRRTSASVVEMDSWLSTRGYDRSRAKYQPLKIGPNYYAIVLDASSGDVVGIPPFILRV
jgi:hypothetical protein